jgi:Family of unknown function (DUF6178)
MTTGLARTRPSSSQLLARILETPDLAAAVRDLPAPALARLIDRVGLEDAGELVALATTEQLARVFDEDLWRSDRAGEDERFDADRFLVWLAVMLEAGDAFVAEKLSELPPDLVTLAFHQQLLVLDLDTLMSELQEGEHANASEKALSNCLAEEVSEYQLISRRHEGWDDVIAAILALDRDHHDFLLGLLERCCALSTEYIEDNGGLFDVLTSEEMLEADVAAEREDRRAEEGHVAPSSAAGFLKLARTATAMLPREHDPLTAAYLRGLGKRAIAAPASTPPQRSDLRRLLRESADEDASAAPRLRSPRDDDRREAVEPLLSAALRRLGEEAPHKLAARSEELAYLANVLAAGCSFDERRMRPIEAVRAALATTSLGLELSLVRTDDAVGAAASLLREHPADAFFRVAWSRLHRDVVHPARALLEEARGLDRLAPDELETLRGLAGEYPHLCGAFFASARDLTRAHELLTAFARRRGGRAR